ncbi:MAG: adenylate/guanylate cyclase domain-containing protein [Alphaproteobacteria bacterium]|jgi:adenylate cyclase
MSADGPAVLVVDDNEDNRYTLTRRLNRLGYANLTEAVDGRAALDALAADKFDLVLLDIMMPEMNGYEVLEHIKADMSLRDIPVIMISAVDEMESVVRCIELGAEDYLSKPFNATLLKARVGASLDKKKLRDQEASYLERIEREQQRSDELLHAILPEGAVRELKSTNEVQPRRYDDVAVMFCDIVSFTAYCEQNPPEKVVGELQELVCRFEDIVFENGLEKIKTIGDAFLATADLLRKVDDPVIAAVRAGRAMVSASQEMDPGWQVRVGVHFGPVVAGIVGRRQFMFDLWGDTVNVAARVSDQAAPGSVVLSGDAWMQIRHAASGQSRGMVPLKGRGEMELVEVTSLG